MAAEVDIYRVRAGETVKKIATNVTPNYTDTNRQYGDKYFLVPNGASQPAEYTTDRLVTNYTMSDNAITRTVLT